MAKWNTAPTAFVLLLALLVLIGMIQVLPQVDLPDTAFHEDTAPIVLKFRSTAALVMASVNVSTPALPSVGLVSESLEPVTRPVAVSGNFVPILHCSLLC